MDDYDNSPEEPPSSESLPELAHQHEPERIADVSDDRQQHRNGDQSKVAALEEVEAESRNGLPNDDHVELDSLASGTPGVDEDDMQDADRAPRPLSKDYTLSPLPPLRASLSSSNSPHSLSNGIVQEEAEEESIAPPVIDKEELVLEQEEEELVEETFDEVLLSSEDKLARSTTPIPLHLQPQDYKVEALPQLPPPVPARSLVIDSTQEISIILPTDIDDVPPPSSSFPRRSSLASTIQISAPGSSSIVSGVLIVSSLELIAASKEARKSKPLKDALDAALDALRNPLPSTSAGGSGTVEPHIIFTPLRLACETKSLPLMISALDCIGKLVSYDFFIDHQSHKEVVETNDDGEAPPRVEGETIPLADLVTTTVCDCFSPSPASSTSSTSSSTTTTQHDTLLLRLLSCILSLILSSALSVHQSSLLKAVRTVYNIFLMGSAGTVQTVAQATLGQIVGGVFGRVSIGDEPSRESPVTRNGTHSPAESMDSRRPSATMSSRASRVDLSTVNEKGIDIEEEDEGEETVSGLENGTNGLHSETTTLNEGRDETGTIVEAVVAEEEKDPIGDEAVTM